MRAFGGKVKFIFRDPEFVFPFQDLCASFPVCTGTKSLYGTNSLNNVLKHFKSPLTPRRYFVVVYNATVDSIFRTSERNEIGEFEKSGVKNYSVRHNF